MDGRFKLSSLFSFLRDLYSGDGGVLLFHGWFHVSFVRSKSLFFARSNGADLFFVESAALVHDLNYLVEKNSSVVVGSSLRKRVLLDSGYTLEEVDRIEKIVIDADISFRDKNVSLESQALSDADMLFKSLPFTPVLFASKYLEENNISLEQLAQEITSKQNSLMEKDLYFYSDVAKEKYFSWAKTNLKLWDNILESLEDPDIKKVLDDYRGNKE